MKKSLLLSLMATAGMTAFAAQPEVVMSESGVTASALSQQTVSRQVDSASLQKESAVATYNNGGVKIKAATDTLNPYYALPGGVFRQGCLADYDYGYTATSNVNTMVVPSYVNIDWEAKGFGNMATLPEANWSFIQFTNQGGGQYSLSTVKATGTTVTTPAYPYADFDQTWDAPQLTMGDKSYNAAPIGMLTYPPRGYNFGAIGVKMMSYARFSIGQTSSSKYYAGKEYTDSIFSVQFHMSNGLQGNQTGLGLHIPKPAGMYCMTAVTMAAGVLEFQSEKMGFNVYKVASTTPVPLRDGSTGSRYTLGDKIGGGYLLKDSIKISSSPYTYVIPIKEQIGEYEMDGYLNVDSEIIILFEGFSSHVENGKYVGDLVAPYLYSTFNPYLPADGVFRMEGEGVVSTNIYGYTDKVTGRRIPINTYAIGILPIYGTLAAYDEEDYYTFKANVAGEEKTFEFEPSMNLNDESGMAVVEGEGAYDWYDIVVGDYDKTTGIQTVTVKVNALPAGVTGRSSDLLVKIPGAEQVIKITQGEVSGIDSVVSDAAVVSSTYFDLMGRELNAEPETGMFIRQDVKADGTKVATKVVK